MTKLTKTEFDTILEILLRLSKEHDICHHEALIWLQQEIYLIIKCAESTREQFNN